MPKIKSVNEKGAITVHFFNLFLFFFFFENDDSSNPVWLKDKGDEFYKNHDYYSAINAYN